jgi:hypothetical protein
MGFAAVLAGKACNAALQFAIFVFRKSQNSLRAEKLRQQHRLRREHVSDPSLWACPPESACSILGAHTLVMGTPSAAIAFLQATVSQWNNDSGDPEQFDTTALAGITDITAAHGRLSCRLPVSSRVINRYGTLHGGCIGKLLRLGKRTGPGRPGWLWQLAKLETDREAWYEQWAA